MPTKIIDWNDGTGDKIYLTYASATGNQNVAVSSDVNRGAARAMIVGFSTGNISRELIVEQEAALVPIQDTLAVNPSGYIERGSGSAYYNLSNPSNAYTDETSTTYAQIGLVRGSEGAVTRMYFTFDTSSIPAGATIDSISCNAKVYISNRTSSNIAVHTCQMYSGTTAKGTASNVTGSGASVYTMSMGTWLRSEVNDVRICLYAERGTANLNTSYYFRFYGATLTIVYTYMGVQQTLQVNNN